MTIENKAPEFWESNFIEKKEMWGFEPSHSAVLTKDFFVGKSVKNVLIPGIGYGRNARIFSDSGIDVTGIEISKTAIELAEKHYGTTMTIYHGSVTDMPFDNCQLSENGYMVFAAISKEAHTYGKGKLISRDRYEVFDGVKMFFYDKDSIQAEFGNAGLIEITEVNENYPFFLIKCKKSN